MISFGVSVDKNDSLQLWENVHNDEQNLTYQIQNTSTDTSYN